MIHETLHGRAEDQAQIAHCDLAALIESDVGGLAIEGRQARPFEFEEQLVEDGIPRIVGRIKAAYDSIAVCT